jgi:hypothetical protein
MSRAPPKKWQFTHQDENEEDRESFELKNKLDAK